MQTTCKCFKTLADYEVFPTTNHVNNKAVMCIYL